MFQFERFCQDHRVPVAREGHHHCHAGWIQTHCPQCAGGRSGYHLGFSVEGGNLNCWRCGSVRVVDFIRQAARCSPERAKDLRAQYEGKGSRKVALRTRRSRALAPEPPNMGPLGPRHVRYLREVRGLRAVDAVAETWGLRGTGHLSREWSWRVVAPVVDDRGDAVAWVGRAIGEGVEPRYKVTDEADCGADPASLLYGLHRAAGDTVLVVEGPGDVWNVGPGAVATLGISWKRQQVNRLRKFKRRFVMFDPEPAAQAAADALAEALSVFPGETEVITGHAVDPGGLSRREVRELRREVGL